MDYEVNDNYLDDDDDVMCSSSWAVSSGSEDENPSVFFTAPNQTGRTTSKKLGKTRREEDDFEKEVSAELTDVMNTLARPFMTSSKVGSSSTSKPRDKSQSEEQYYDEVYFDSDDSEEDSSEQSTRSKRKQKRRILSNDELMYDPNMDDDDQAWVNDKRRSYQVNRAALGNSGKRQPLPQSDAVLNCPACMSLLCLDCQRHEIYRSQYRAMFVFNCRVDCTVVLHMPKKESKWAKKKKKKGMKFQQEALDITQAITCEAHSSQTNMDSSSLTGSAGACTSGDLQVVGNSVADTKNLPTLDSSKEAKEGKVTNNQSDLFNPVHCTICNTKVAVYDKDEVYHFFNVLASY